MLAPCTPPTAPTPQPPPLKVPAPQFPPPTVPARLGRDKEVWAELLMDERAAAEKLGYSEESWEHGDPPACSSAWHTLDTEQRTAAMALGYERVIWDAEYEVDQPHIHGKDKEGWHLLTVAEKRAAMALGYERRTWDEGFAPEICSHPTAYGVMPCLCSCRVKNLVVYLVWAPLGASEAETRED